MNTTKKNKPKGSGSQNADSWKIVDPLFGALGRMSECDAQEVRELIKQRDELQRRNDELLAASRCALADLEGIMPEFEASGDREHPAWITIKELTVAIRKAEGSK
jgi:hypothetical protein